MRGADSSFSVVSVSGAAAASGRIILAAYLVRGSVTENLKEADYIVELYSEMNRLPPGLVLMQKNKIGKEEYRIWKRKK